MKKFLYILLIPSIIFQLASNLFDSRSFFVDKVGKVISNNLYLNPTNPKYQFQVKYAEDDIVVETIESLDTYNKTINNQVYTKQIPNDEVSFLYFVIYIISLACTFTSSLFLIQMRQEESRFKF